MRKTAALIILLSFLVLGCQPKTPKELTQITALQQNSSGDTSVNNIRRQAIQDTAMSMGMQAGLAWRSHQLNSLLLTEEKSLDRVFNFNGLILKNNVLPPVLTEGDTTLNIDTPDDQALRLSDKIYKIERPPRFVTTPPTWREYLWLDFREPSSPNSTLLPKNEPERQMWNHYIKAGWRLGVNQADQIFSVNLGRLKRDYAGMVLYRQLLAQNMVTAPYVAKVNLGVTGDSNLMRINDKVLRITSTSRLNINAKTWKPVITAGEAGGEDTDADQANQGDP